ncbi:MAG: dihydrolipoamide acetyltransferase family protein [Polyangiales bacterium]
MGALQFRLPDIGEGVSEGEIVEWHVRVGDTVREDDPMVEILTDKATVTIGAPCDALVERLCFEVGEVSKVGQVLLTLRPTVASNVGEAQRSSRPPTTAVGHIQDELPGARLFGPSAATGSARGKLLASPATRGLAKNLGVDLREARPSGPGGRLTEDDVRAVVRARKAEGTTSALETREPIVGLRRKIAEHMHRAKSTAAHFTFVEECDASPLVELRQSLLPDAERVGVHLTFLPFIIKAVTGALQRHPILNSEVDERTGELVYKKFYNIGVATATDAGLVVPVIKNADGLGIFELARRIERLSRSAKDGTIGPEDLRNSTFTVTSLGRRSGLFATPILNHPEVGILGVHRIKQRPVVRAGAVEIGQVMLLSLTLDHRVVDGHVGAAFAYDIIEALENSEASFRAAL